MKTVNYLDSQTGNEQEDHEDEESKRALIDGYFSEVSENAFGSIKEFSSRVESFKVSLEEDVRDYYDSKQSLYHYREILKESKGLGDPSKEDYKGLIDDIVSGKRWVRIVTAALLGALLIFIFLILFDMGLTKSQYIPIAATIGILLMIDIALILRVPIFLKEPLEEMYKEMVDSYEPSEKYIMELEEKVEKKRLLARHSERVMESLSKGTVPTSLLEMSETDSMNYLSIMGGEEYIGDKASGTSLASPEKWHLLVDDEKLSTESRRSAAHVAEFLRPKKVEYAN